MQKILNIGGLEPKISILGRQQPNTRTTWSVQCIVKLDENHSLMLFIPLIDND